ncbi:MAG: RNA polymerase sigma factor [Dokdonella sp.]
MDTGKGEQGGAVNRETARIYDELLVAAAVTGDRAALTRLVVRWHPRLLRHAWRVLGDAERAKDMVQEAWVEILRGLSRLNDVAAFPAWAYRIVTRRCQREFHRKSREPFERDGEELLDVAETPETASGETAAELASVAAAISKLPAPQRAALALFYIEDLSIAEIAIATDVPPGTVKTRLMHARRKVRELLLGDSS